MGRWPDDLLMRDAKVCSYCVSDTSSENLGVLPTCALLHSSIYSTAHAKPTSCSGNDRLFSWRTKGRTENISVLTRMSELM